MDGLEEKFDDKVHVISEADVVLEKLFNIMDEAEETFDVYADFRGPNIVDDVEGGISHYIAAQKRGVKTRVITEITEENLSFCKQNMKYVEGLRHLDTITHMFEVSEKHYGSAKMLAEGPHLLEGVFCNISWFVKAQQYLFESLWRKAIPAKQRFKEIEEGSKREFIETIRDPLEIVELIPQVLSSTYEELSILFPTIKTFKRFESDGLFELVKHQVDKFNIYVRLLVKRDNHNYNYNKPDTEIESLKKYQQNIELQFVNKLETSMLTVIGDRDKLLTIEIQDDSEMKMVDSLGLATYSNSEPTIISHSSIFETSWIQSQIRRNQK